MPEEQAARQLAKKAAHERGMKFVRVAGVKRVGDHWIIQVESFPPSFGGHASVEISESKVIKYRPGK